MKMGRFDKYRVDLKGMKQASLQMEFDLNNLFFADIDGQEFQKGAVKATVDVRNHRGVFDFTFAVSGTVVVPCDRCLDEMEVDVEAENSLRVKLGDTYADEGDTVVIPESEGEINLAWYLYEFIALALPTKRIHAPGKCNLDMSDKLKKHTRRDDMGDEECFDTDEREEREIDPRWAGLKNLQLEDN